MASTNRTTGTDHDVTTRDVTDHVGHVGGRRISTETKAAFKTTEFLAYLATVIAIAIASQVVGEDSGANDGGDYFLADKALFYITLVTIGYLVSRGLAKSGSRDFYDDKSAR